MVGKKCQKVAVDEKGQCYSILWTDDVAAVWGWALTSAHWEGAFAEYC